MLDTISPFRLVKLALSFGFLLLTSKLFTQQLDSSLTQIAFNHDAMGAATLVFCETDILHEHYIGYSDFQRGIKVNPDTYFRVASISKLITAMAFMQLVEENEVSLDQSIHSILGYAPINPAYPSINLTPRMLLSHTSSIIDGPGYSSFLQASVGQNPIPDLSEILLPSGSFYHSGQFNALEPGSYFNYSNLNYVILGTLIEKISGMRFDAYCRQTIFEPLNLDASFNVNDLDSIDLLAVLYRKVGGVWQPQADDFQGVQPVHTNLDNYLPGTNAGRWGPQGSLRIKARDLARLLQFFMQDEEAASSVLSRETLLSMMQEAWAYTGSNGNSYGDLFLSWGLGVHRITGTPGKDQVLTGSEAMFGHTGEAYGLVSDAFLDTTRKVGFVWMTNGVGAGFVLNASSAFYTIEQEVFTAIEQEGELESCQELVIEPFLSPKVKMQLFPNPCYDRIRISNLTPGENSLLRIYSLEGILLLSEPIREESMVLELAHLPPGVYGVRWNDAFEYFVKVN